MSLKTHGLYLQLVVQVKGNGIFKSCSLLGRCSIIGALPLKLVLEPQDCLSLSLRINLFSYQADYPRYFVTVMESLLIQYTRRVQKVESGQLDSSADKSACLTHLRSVFNPQTSRKEKGMGVGEGQVQQCKLIPITKEVETSDSWVCLTYLASPRPLRNSVLKNKVWG